MFRHTGPKTRFQMREKLASIGDDSWIEDDDGTKVFKVNGKAMRIRDTFLLEDAQTLDEIAMRGVASVLLPPDAALPDSGVKFAMYVITRSPLWSSAVLMVEPVTV